MNKKENKITIRFSDEELDKIKNLAIKQDLKVATFIRNVTLKSIEDSTPLSHEIELRDFIVKTIEEANDKKLGRIISLLFRATSHIDIVKEQNNIFFQNIKVLQDVSNIRDNNQDHYITKVAEKKIGNRDFENIKRSKGKSVNFEVDE